MKTATVIITASAALIIGSAAAFAGDMWTETPDLNNLTKPSFITGSAGLANRPPAIDQWAETPDLNDNDATVDFHHENVAVKSGLADSEMYAETPDLNNLSPVVPALPLADDAVAAHKGKDQTAE